MDNRKPWYAALYEVPGNRTEATEAVRKAAKASGFSLVEGTPPPNPEDNKFYVDQTSKQSVYPALNHGNVQLILEIYGSSTYTGNGDKYCTVTKRSDPPRDTTTIDITINLPAYKN